MPSLTRREIKELYQIFDSVSLLLIFSLLFKKCSWFIKILLKLYFFSSKVESSSIQIQ